MPIYEYECARCGQIEEAIQKFSDRPLNKCSHCSGKLHRLISQSAFHLKGAGWYADGYADKPRKNSKASQGDKQSPPASKKDTSTSGSEKKQAD
jgi:putative FmdB family regulatory protein